MKKYTSLLLLLFFLLCFAACNHQPPHAPVSTPTGGHHTDGAGCSGNAAIGRTTTPATSGEGEWVVNPYVQQPEFPEPQIIRDVAYFPAHDLSFEVNRYKAAWADANPDEMLAILKAMPFFRGWDWQKSYTERGFATVYEDIGQQNSYEYTVSLIAEKPIDGTRQRVIISFVAQTDEYVGWRSVSVNYSVPGVDMGLQHQEAIKPVLELIYGSAADYMLYAPLTNERHKEMALKVKTEHGTEIYSRTMLDGGVSFSERAHSNLYSALRYYAGEYTPVLAEGNLPECYADIFGAFAPLNFVNVECMGSEFFGEWYVGYISTAPNPNGKMYEYCVTDYKNGDRDVVFEASLILNQKDAAFVKGMPFEMCYEAEIRDGRMVVNKAEANVPVVSEGYTNNDDNDPVVIQRLDDNLAYAKRVANAVFGTEYKLSNVYWNGIDNNALTSSVKTVMYGREVTMRFNFTTRTIDSINKNRASVNITVS